jgi:hypothetical protein
VTKAESLDDAGVWDDECPSCAHTFPVFHGDWTDATYEDALALLPAGQVFIYRPVRYIRQDNQEEWAEYTCPRCNHQWTEG